jgi:hypothetical protein
MRNRRLHDSLRAFALDAARVLSADIEAGAEVEFELDERSTGRSVLYRYRPLIAGFIGQRWQQLRTLESFGPASEELGSGAAAYLRVQGLAADADPEPALLAMLERIWEDATSFGFPEERFERVYGDVERALYEGVLQSAIAAPLPGLVMERDRVELGDGLVLVRGDLSGAPPEAVWPAGSVEIERGRAQPNVVALIEAELPVDATLPLPEARWRLRRLVTAMRLWRGGSIALPAVGWARADDGPWRQVALQPAPPARGGAWTLREEEEDGFRQFAALVADWEPSGPIGWGLARFDMGCERGSDAEALSDYMLALRGLLDAMDEAGQPTLARRLAALCAEEDARPLLQARVEAALSLELALVAGVPIDAWSAPPGVSSPRDVVIEIEEHLRALLRDVACGYLKPTLASTADDILLRTTPIEVDARDLRGDVEIDHAHTAAPLHPPTHAADAEPLAGEWDDREAEDEWSTPDPRLAPVAERPPLVQLGAFRVPLRPQEAEPMSPQEADPMSPPEAEPKVTRVEPTVATVDEDGQTALVVDDFAWDIDDPDDYAAGV